MNHYQHIDKITVKTANEIKKCLKDAVWKPCYSDGSESAARHFYTWVMDLSVIEHIEGLQKLWDRPRWRSAFFLNIPAGGVLHRHRDVDTEFKTYHIPIVTNDQCVSIMYDPEPHEYHLKARQVYRVDRQTEHESFNHGNTDRIHLLMQVYD